MITTSVIAVILIVLLLAFSACAVSGRISRREEMDELRAFFHREAK